MPNQKPVLHGRDHKGQIAGEDDGVYGGADPATLNVDSTENVGDDQGVHSFAASAGAVLTSDGAGGSEWGAGGGGIAFDTDNQGGYLLVTTNDLEPGTGSYGMVLQDDTDGMLLRTLGTSSALELEAVDGNISLLAGGTGAAGSINLEAEDIINIYSQLDVNVNADRDVGVYLATAGRTFTVYDSSSQPIFRVDEDGDLHGETGKALVFDL